MAREVKQRFPECCLISDVAMDPYSSDGHDGLDSAPKSGDKKTYQMNPAN